MRVDPFDQRSSINPTPSAKMPIPRWDIYDQHKGKPDERSLVFQSGFWRKGKEVVSKKAESTGKRKGEGRRRGAGGR